MYIRPAIDGHGMEVLRGRAEIREMFARRSARKSLGENLHHHEFRTVAVDGSECFVEGVGIVDGTPFAVFVAHATLGEDGLVTRYLGVNADAPGGVDSSTAA